MIRFIQIGVLLIGISVPIEVSAQKDLNAWTGIDLRMPITKKLGTGLQIEGRFDNNLTEVDQTFISPYVKYELHKHIGLELAYRYANRPEGGFFGPYSTHRVSFDLGFKDLFKAIDLTPNNNLDFDARLRFTHRTDKGELNNDYLRARFKLDYKFKKIKLTPHIATEFFFHFNDQLSYTPTEVISTHRFNKYRIRAGLGYEPKKRMS